VEGCEDLPKSVMSMAIKYHITTTKPDEFEERLKVIQLEFIKYQVGVVEWKRRGNEIWINIEYKTENRLYDIAVRKRLEGRFKNLDKDVKIEKV
jgi:hypothetical protein